MKFKTQTTSFLGLALLLANTACRSTDNTLDTNTTDNRQVNVKMNLSGSEGDIETSEKLASVKNNLASTGIQTQTIPYDNTYSITATLVPVKASLSGTAALNPMAAATELKSGIRYKVLVYDSNSKLVDQKEFVYKQNETDGFMLDGGKTYTFVAFSVNSTNAADTPTVTNPDNLSTAMLSNISKDLMYYKIVKTVTGNTPNTLDVVLKHQFTRVTTNIDASQVESTGIITRVNSPVFSGGNASAQLQFNNDAQLSYTGSNTTSFNFPNINQSKITSDPAIIIGNTPNGASLNIGNLIIDGTSKNNVLFSNLKITPRSQYNLNLKFTPCTKFNMNPTPFDQDASVTSKYFGFNGIPDRFIVDFTYVDNSFSFLVNGTRITADEIQFDGQSGTVNIQFPNGNKWGQSGGIPAIYNIAANSPTAPVIRVVIDRNGNTTFYGKRQSGDLVLEPLTYTGTGGIKKITWTSGYNEVYISQVASGPTRIKGTGYGKQNTTCP
ncbi:TPA: fimbrillin family protein [Elizabethkingia anophelis]|uniref:fimbrillin family protein n=1 Tax=Elizabethkingia anophelis TaxID=1117645 RepID=UPI0020114465|nr:fimbrillin family protein [Elizabethkingia anophelis]MCL1641289.1 fimbrillin family protein [Elizabethkingia anophelis]MCL1646100.1 fimbrillin family protein [Elizabethkingia anophelis]MCT3927517.1 hypothetical protein [Elizabethkingia anophelis]MCT4033656.1 hypothetical protein [Elizabethkingia anophelis]MCT4101932.1 hypothetical protein [Elizabethkingia anophelis]